MVVVATATKWSMVKHLKIKGFLLKNPPAKQETLVQFLGGEYPLEKGTATHSSIWAWRIPPGAGCGHTRDPVWGLP